MAKVLSVISVQSEPFDVGAEIAALARGGSQEIGGIASFIGTVRGSANGRPIRALTLEHYPAMTERSLRRIADEAKRRFSLLACTVIHRVGRLEPGTEIVLVLTASAHRQATLDATAFLIDWLKTEAPFWKSEEYADGTSAWVSQTDIDRDAVQRWSMPA